MDDRAIKVRAALDELDEGWSPEDESYQVGEILISSLVVGPNADKIAALLNRPRSFVRQYAQRCREQGTWVGNRVCANWFDDETGGVAFFCDINVAMGFLERCEAS